MRALFAAFTCLASLHVAAAPAPAAPPAPVRVLVLGTFHFANPGADVHNIQADDMLAPARQAQISATVQGLARFAPTMVAVEADGDDAPGRSMAGYARFRAGTLKPTADETVQIGYRLAQAVGLERVVGIDMGNAFPFRELQTFARLAGRGAELDAMSAAVGAQVADFGARLPKMTVAQALREMNEPARLAADHGFYMSALRFGDGALQPGADMTGLWAQRNLQICARLVQSAKPGDRVVVVYGAGHAHLLRQCVREMPGYELVEAGDYLPR